MTANTNTTINPPLNAIANAAIVTADAIRLTVRRLIRTAHAILTVTRRHVPAWMGAVLTICLLVPGPVDELLVLLAIAGMAAFKPAMRAEFAQTVPQGWAAASVEQHPSLRNHRDGAR
jgi:hypothetical protein